MPAIVASMGDALFSQVIEVIPGRSGSPGRLGLPLGGATPYPASWGLNHFSTTNWPPTTLSITPVSIV
jgi:hypothetical protein